MSETIAAAARIDMFLKDEAIASALGKLERQYYEAFKKAATDEDRRVAQAKANVLADFLTELHVILDAGERETLSLLRQNRAQPH